MDSKNDNFRAIWVFNIANNVIWETDPAIDKYRIGVYTNSPNLFKEISKLSENQKINNKEVEVIHFTKVKSIEYVQILYLGFDKNIDIFRINDIIQNWNTLLITDRLDEKDNIMVNILPFDSGDKRIEIDRMNIEAHNLTVTDQLLYHGGSEEELKDLYAQQKKQLDLQIEEVEKKKKEVAVLQEDLENQKQLIEEQKIELQRQKERLLEMSSKLKQQEQILLNNEEKLTDQENLIKSKQREVQEKIAELDKQEIILKTKNEEITNKQNELKKLETQIDDAKSDLTNANQQIETQKGMIVIGTIFLIVVLIFSIFLWRALQKNSKMNKELTSKNKEINQQKDRIEHQAKLLENSNKELEKLSIVAENAQNGVVIMDENGEIEWVNAGFTKMYGYTHQLLINERDSNLKFVSENPEIEKYVNKCINEKVNVTYEQETTKRDGNKLWVKTTLTPIINEQDQIEKLVAIDTDISEIKQAEEEIKEQAIALEISNKELEKLSVVVSETDNAVLITDEKGNIEWVNKAFIDTFGFTLEEFVEKVSKNIISDTTDNEIKQKFDYLFKNKKPITYELNTHNKQNKEIWLQANVTPIIDKNNNIQKIVIVDADITAMKEAEQEIKEKNYELTLQKEKIELQNTKISASILYAQTIQQAILPLKENTSKYFDSEIIYRPKDIVSGDFYWFYPVDETNTYYTAAVDCTGHGVPGAFMSLITSRILNDILNNDKNIEPHKILEQTDLQIKKALRQEQTNNNDGIDIALCKIIKQDDKFFNVFFAGAKINLYFYNKKTGQINQISSTRRSIGGVKKTRNSESFESKNISLQKGDIIYLMTDGIIDQNNFKRKRFGSQNIIKAIDKVKDFDLNIQKMALENELISYMNNTEQRDDITCWFIKL